MLQELSQWLGAGQSLGVANGGPQVPGDVEPYRLGERALDRLAAERDRPFDQVGRVRLPLDREAGALQFVEEPPFDGPPAGRGRGEEWSQRFFPGIVVRAFAGDSPNPRHELLQVVARAWVAGPSEEDGRP